MPAQYTGACQTLDRTTGSRSWRRRVAETGATPGRCDRQGTACGRSGNTNLKAGSLSGRPPNSRRDSRNAPALDDVGADDTNGTRIRSEHCAIVSGVDDRYLGLPADVQSLASCDYSELTSRLKAAKWLVEEVGIGNRYQVTALKRAFPSISQIDRRARDLRNSGWIIHTNGDDPGLALDEHRLVHIGDLQLPRSPTGRVRYRVFERDGNRCVVCGIGAGETYPDEPTMTAKLTLGHWVAKAQGGDPTDEDNLRTECARCNHAIQAQQGAVAAPESVRARIDALNQRDRSSLLTWMESNSRPQPQAEVLWYQWRQLPPSVRDQLREHLLHLVHGPRR